MQTHQPLFWITLALILLLSNGAKESPMMSRCARSIPSVKQRQVGKGKFTVQVRNNCATCPVIDIHVKCGGFPQSLVNPKLFKVLNFDDCVVNSGLPLPPLEAFYFNYSHSSLYPFYSLSWYFQCE